MTNVFTLPADILRPQPANLEAEQALLGTLLQRNSAFDKVSDYLKLDHFSDAANARLFEIISRTISLGQKADPVTLKAHAESDPMLQQAGGMKYLVGLVAAAPTTINAGEYGRIIHDLFLRREIITLSTQAAATAYDTSSPAPEQIEAIEERLFGLSSSESESSIALFGMAVGEAIDQADVAFKADGALTGVTTGLVDLDYMLGGLHPSDLIILAGRPSMGKSGLALTVAINAAKAGKTVAFFSLEMSAAQLANRAMSYFTHLDSHKVRNGRIGAADFGKLSAYAQSAGGLPLLIDDRAGVSVAQIRTACRRLARKKLDLVVIDYLQLIGNGPDRSENRVQEISAITRGLKMLAKDLGVPVMALSQLSRQVESREDKRPQLSDLRESGTIEQDADVVLFVYRDEYYLSRNGGICPEDLKNVAEVIIAKQRHGPIGPVACRFEHKSAWFENLARHRGA